MGRYLKAALIAACFWMQTSLAHAVDEKKAAVHPVQPDKGKPVVPVVMDEKPNNRTGTESKDKDIAAHLEILKVMDMLEHMDLMKDMDVIGGGKKK